MNLSVTMYFQIKSKMGMMRVILLNKLGLTGVDYNIYNTHLGYSLTQHIPKFTEAKPVLFFKNIYYIEKNHINTTSSFIHSVTIY